MADSYPYPNPNDFWSRCKNNLDACSGGMFMGVLTVLLILLVLYFYMGARMSFKSEHAANPDGSTNPKMPTMNALYSRDPNSPTPAMQSLIDAAIRADPGVSIIPEFINGPNSGGNVAGKPNVNGVPSKAGVPGPLTVDKKEFLENKAENPELVNLLQPQLKPFREETVRNLWR